MKRGDIVLASFPHASGAPPKTRPVLVVQGDYYNRRITNVLVATITSNLHRRNDPAHYLVDVATPEGKQSGLTHHSLVSCLNLAVLSQSELASKIGELPAHAMRAIDQCLKQALGIP